jgi:hypothetical protein
MGVKQPANSVNGSETADKVGLGSIGIGFAEYGAD